MAIRSACRFKPDIFRSGLESLNEGLDPATGAGTIILPVQVVAYDDVKVTGANYIPGAPESEREITVVLEEQLRFDILTLSAMTNAALTTYLKDQLVAWASDRKVAATPVGKIMLVAKRMAPQAIP